MKNSIILFMMLFVGCSYSRPNIEEKEATLKLIDIKNSSILVDSLNLSDAASGIDIVKLETTSQSLIRMIQNIVVTSQYIFVHDLTEGILKFSLDGKFLNKIEKKGEGPEDYLNIFQFIVKEDEEALYFYTVKGFKVYDYEGRFKKSIAFEDKFYGNENRIIMFKDNFFLNDKLPVLLKLEELSETKDFWTFALTDSMFNIHKKYYNPDFKGQEKHILDNAAVFSGWKNYWTENFASVDFYNDTFMMKFYGGDTIYIFSDHDKEFESCYTLLYGDKPSFELSHQWAKSKDYYKFINITKLYNTRNYLYFVASKHEDVYIYRYDKVKNNIIYHKYGLKLTEKTYPGADFTFVKYEDDINFILNNDFIGGLFIVNYKGSCNWISTLHAQDLVEIKSNLEKSNNYSNLDKINKLFDFIKNSNDDDNPILLIAKLK